MTIEDKITNHAAALLGEGRPPTPLDINNVTAEDSVVWSEWHAAAPRKISEYEQSLIGSSFRDADLRLAGFYGSDLTDCDFRDTDLRGADLRGCTIEGCNFIGAELDESTRIGGVILGDGLANRTSLAVILEAVGGDAEEEQTKALVQAIQAATT